jgi:hypothetical protein
VFVVVTNDWVEEIGRNNNTTIRHQVSVGEELVLFWVVVLYQNTNNTRHSVRGYDGYRMLSCPTVIDANALD